jgi:hypothetical protein
MDLQSTGRPAPSPRSASPNMVSALELEQEGEAAFPTLQVRVMMTSLVPPYSLHTVY